MASAMARTLALPAAYSRASHAATLCQSRGPLLPVRATLKPSRNPRSLLATQSPFLGTIKVAGPGVGLPLPKRTRTPRSGVRAQASSAAGAGDGTKGADVAVAPQSSGKAQLAIIFGVWYVFNVVFNIYNKKVLNAFPVPWLTSCLSLLAGALFMSLLWLTRLHKYTPVTKDMLKALAPVALFHTIGHVAATVSMSKVAVSFTHIIKSSEPALSVIIQSLFMGATFPTGVFLSLVPIIGGCAIAATTELSFNWTGFWGAMISNLAFVFRNIYSKRQMEATKELDAINTYAWISIISLFYLTPVTLLVEGPQWSACWDAAIKVVPAKQLLVWMGAQSLFYHLYNQTSYQALGNVSPLTFSIGNTMKRVVVIVASVIAFKNPVSPVNAAGSAVAILGTYLYSVANANSKKKSA